MQWFVAAVVGLFLLIGLPVMIVQMKRSDRRKPRLRGVGQSIEAGFGVFDPAKARAVQIIEIRHEIGHADEGDQGDLFDKKHSR